MKLHHILLSLVLFLGISLAQAEPININTADAETFATAMVGVGSKLGQAIVDHRDRNGDFKTVDQITEVKGIGDKILEKNRSKLSIGQTEKQAQAKPINPQ